MGGTPLVALDLKTPQQPDLLEKYSQLQQLRGQQQQLQMQQQEAPVRQQILGQQAQLGQAQVQQQQQALKDQQAMTAAWGQYDGKDPSQLPKLIIQNGGSGQAAQAVQAKLLEQRKTLSEIAAQDATTGSKNIETRIKTGDAVAGALSPLTDPTKVPDAQLPQALTDTVQSLQQQGLLDPQHAQAATALIQQASGDPAKIRSGIGIFSKTLLTQSQIAKEAKDEADIANQKALRDQAATTAAETARHNAADEKAAGQRISIEGARLNFERQKEANAMGDSPEGAGLIDSIGTGKIAIDRLGYLVAKNPGLLEAVSKKYPDFDSTKAGAYVNAYKDFTSTKAGTAGGALNAGATALGHLNELKSMNTISSHIPGTPDYNAYMNKVDTVATELAKFYGDSTVSGIAAIRKTLASTLPGNRDAAIATQAQSMGDKFDAYQQSWDNAAPSKAYEAPMPGISAKASEARAALDPRFKAAQVTRQAPSGMVTVQIPGSPAGQIPAAAVAKFKADHPNAVIQ